MQRLWLAIALLVCAAAALSAQQVKIESILKYVNDDFVTTLEVRQARLLDLVDPASKTDDEIAMRIIERRLELAEIKRVAPRDPAPPAVQARRAEWEATLGGANVANLLREAGMSEVNLTNWLRDDVRIQTYEEQVFGARATPTRAEMLDYFQRHIAEYTKDGVAQTFEAAGAQVRRQLRDANMAVLVKAWAESLVRRADVR